MLFQYIGDGQGSPETAEVYGHTFTLNGASVDITDAKAIAKLKANATFTHDSLTAVLPPPAVEEDETQPAQPEQDNAGEVHEFTYHEKLSFIASKGAILRSRKGADVDAQYQELLADE